MFWDLLQQAQINSSQKSADNADLKASIAQVNIQHLESQVQTLALANQAMWELLSKQIGITEKDLLNKMSEIDMRDGVLDGKLSVKTFGKGSDVVKK